MSFCQLFAGGFQQGEGAVYVGLDEGFRTGDGAVDVGLGGEVDDGVDVVVCEQPVDQLGVADVAVHEAVVGGVVDVFEVLQVTGVGERIQVDDAILRMGLEPVADEIGADEAGAAGDEEVFHFVDPLSLTLSRREREYNRSYFFGVHSGYLRGHDN